MDRVNQQETATDIELSWLAGIIDGEGHIGISRMMSHRDKPTLNPRISIGNTNVLIISQVCKILDKIPISGHIEKRQKGGKDGEKNWKEAWVVQLSQIEKINAFLTKILPFLVGKKAQAELVQRFTESRMKNRKYGAGYSDEEVSLYQQMAGLNAKGVNQDPQRLHVDPRLLKPGEGKV